MSPGDRNPHTATAHAIAYLGADNITLLQKWDNIPWCLVVQLHPAVQAAPRCTEWEHLRCQKWRLHQTLLSRPSLLSHPLTPGSRDTNRPPTWQHGGPRDVMLSWEIYVWRHQLRRDITWQTDIYVFKTQQRSRDIYVRTTESYLDSSAIDDKGLCSENNIWMDEWKKIIQRA